MAALCLSATLMPARAVVTSDYAVQASAVVQSAPPQITLNWPADSTGAVTNYIVSRRLPGVAAWTSLGTLPASTTNFTDTNVALNGRYEYEVKKLATGFNGYGYVLAGIESPLVESRGKLLLVVDSFVAPPLTNELGRLQQDLVGDGWQVQRFDVARNDAVTSVKAVIQAAYLTDTQQVRSVFLFGHVPVPYSGNLAPDGHTEHRGAWPADLYYGEMTSAWTDSTVTRTNATDTRNRNSPGDGKFDATTIPSDVELEVGRVDFANLRSIPTSEVELLRQYLNKDHAFRHKLFDAERRGFVDDNFGTMSGEAFAATGWRGFAAMFGADQVSPIAYNNWFTVLSTNAVLFAYGCGGGTFTSADGVSRTSDYAGNDPGAVFSFLFGSYFGDWDSTDNLMRASLATQTYTLTCAWAGRPHWFVHHMTAGETIGYSARRSQNNSSTGPYRTFNAGTRQVHVALLGDPTLRLHPVQPASEVEASVSGNGSVTVSWQGSKEEIIGYFVYRSTNSAGPFERITPQAVEGLSFTDSPPAPATYTYMVRAVKLETSASGSYYNASQGAFLAVTNMQAPYNPPSLVDTSSPLSPLQLSVLDDGTMRIQFTAPTGALCRVESVETLDSTNWQTLAGATADANGNVVVDDAPAGRPATRFYRGVLLTP